MILPAAYRSLFRLPRKLCSALSRGCNAARFRSQGVRLGRGSRIEGKVYLRLDGRSTVSIGQDCHIVGGLGINRIGRNIASSLSAGEGAVIRIGDGVGISNSCLWARERIEIGNHVNIGADCLLLDHDAHSLDPMDRRDYSVDKQHIATEPIVIGDDVLIGARCIILKGVHIGARSIVGAGSVVTGDIPAGEIWAGNPARKIR
ncbi:MAG: acyltransferase [Bacteroidales bacterium]|nr:acyltransferase [Bacteroidales bacterium]